jgi:hypothetical protein
LVGQGTRLPDYVVLISTVGGISLFGINGFVIGPLIAALFIAAWSLFAEQQSAEEQSPKVLDEIHRLPGALTTDGSDEAQVMDELASLSDRCGGSFPRRRPENSEQSWHKFVSTTARSITTAMRLSLGLTA